jgi:hypothetical protein
VPRLKPGTSGIQSNRAAISIFGATYFMGKCFVPMYVTPTTASRVQYAVPNVIRANKTRRLRLAGNNAGMEVIRNTNNIFIGKFKTNHVEN